MGKIIRALRLQVLILFFSIALLALSGCVSIPGEAPELSTELGKRIGSIENAHISLLHSYFNEKRDQVDIFVSKEWVPAFAEELFSNKKIAQTWNKIVSSGSKHDRLEFIVRLGPKLQKKINSKRFELIKPLDDLERLVERRLRDEYRQAKAINNTITSFLSSASKVDENRRRYLEMIGITDDSIAEVIDEVDSAVSQLLGKAKQVKNVTEQGEEYVGKLNDALKKFKDGREKKDDD